MKTAKEILIEMWATRLLETKDRELAARYGYLLAIAVLGGGRHA